MKTTGQKFIHISSIFFILFVFYNCLSEIIIKNTMIHHIDANQNILPNLILATCFAIFYILVSKITKTTIKTNYWFLIYMVIYTLLYITLLNYFNQTLLNYIVWTPFCFLFSSSYIFYRYKKAHFYLGISVFIDLLILYFRII